jgi:hypothetical protein
VRFLATTLFSIVFAAALGSWIRETVVEPGMARAIALFDPVADAPRS